MNDSTRYSRQTQLQQIGTAGQQTFRQSSVLIVGAGGLGCQVAAQLAGAGIGQLRIVDHDMVVLSNLHRQILFREADVGKPKAEAAARELAAINSEIEINAAAARLSPANVANLINGVDAVVDAADNHAASYVLSDACLERSIPLISASVNQTFGYLGVFCGSADQPAPSYRAVFPRLPVTQQSCDLAGVTGPGVGVIAGLQAQETLKVLLNDPARLSQQLLYLDLWNYTQHRVMFSNAEEPEDNAVALITAAEINPHDHVIDVRTADEIREQPQHFPVEFQIPLLSLESGLDRLPAEGRIVCACRSGQRAIVAGQQLLDHGFSRVAAVLPTD